MSQNFKVIADVHVGNHRYDGGPVICGVNSRCREILHTLKRVGDGPVVVAGDFFDTDCPSPQLVWEAANACGKDWYWLLGNHDATSCNLGDNALSALKLKYGEERIIERPTVLERFDTLMIPWSTGRARDWLTEAVDGVGGVSSIITHCGIYDDSTHPRLKEVESAIHVDLAFELMAEVGARSFVAGDWHDHKVWSRDLGKVCVVGTLCPTGWGDSGLGRGQVIHVNEDGCLRGVSHIPGPRFMVGYAEENGFSFTVRDPKENIGHCTVRLRVFDSGHGITASEAEREFVSAYPDFRECLSHVEIVTVTPESDKSNNHVPRSTSIREVVDAWVVQSDTIPVGVDTSRVVDRVVDLLTKSIE